METKTPIRERKPQAPRSLKELLTKEAVQADVRRINDAVYAGDIETVLDYFNPEVTKALGGREKVREALKEGLVDLQLKGTKIESVSFPQPPTFIKTAKRYFAIVPTKMVLSVRKTRSEVSNFQLGILEKGASRWTYVEGTNLSVASARKFFPDLPENLQFPK